MLASRIIWRIEDIAPNTPNAEKIKAIIVFPQKRKLYLDGLNTTLYNTIGKMKSRGIQPNAPIKALMSPKKGNIAATVVAIMTDNER